MYLLKSSNSGGGGIFTTPTTPTTTSSPHRQILLPPVSTVHLSSSSTSSSSSSSASLSQSINSHDYCTEAYFTTNESSYDVVIRKTIQDVVTDPRILLDEQINVTGVGDGGGGGGRLHKHNTIITSNCSHDEGIEGTDVGGGGGVTADNLLFDDISAAIEAINEANRLNSACTDDIDDNDCDDVIGGSIDTTSIILQQQQQQEQTQNVPTIATLHPIVALSSSCSASTSSCLDQFITHSMFVNIPMTNITTATATTTMPSIIDYHQSPGLLFSCNNNNANDNNNNTHAYIQIEKKQDSLTNTSTATTTTVGSTSNITSSIPSLLTNTLPLRPIKNTSSLLSLSQSNWRFLLRPIFEKIIIEKLWTSGELGGSNPYSLLLSMWFFISRYFGIGCRTDHAKLAYGNIVIDRNTETGERYLRFTSLPHGTRPPGGSGYGALRRISKLGKELPTFQVKPRHPDTRLLECQSQPDRCPVRLYEAFCSHRPCSTTTIHSPFYLQPDRAAAAIHYYHHNASSSSYPNSSVWFTLNALGKNKIGSMLNGALQSIGMPVGRQVNLTRFCDSLIAAVFSLQPSSSLKNSNNNSISGGDGDVGDLTREACRVSETLRSIILNCRLIIPYQQIPESIQPTISSLAEKVVQLSATRGSPFNNYLAKLSTLKKSVNNKNNGNKVMVKKTNVRKLGKVSSKFLFPSDDDDCSDDDDGEEGHQNQETTDPNNNNHQQQHQLIVFTDNLSHSTVNTNHHHNNNIISTGTTNSTSTEMNIDNHRPLKSSSSDSSLPTMVPMSICFNSKHIDGCYSDHPSLGNGMDDDDDIDGDDDDDVGIDAFDLNQADLSLNNLHNNQIRTGIGTTNNVGNTIDTTNEMNNNTKGGNYCLTNGKISPSIMQENINLGITQNYPFGNIIQTHGQTLIDLASGQLFQLQPQHSNQQQQQQQLLLNNSTEFLLTCPNNSNTNGNINGVLGNVNISSSLSPTVIFVPTNTYTTTAQNNRMELTCGSGVGVGVGGASSSTSPNQGGIGSSISAALPLDESMIDISRLGGIENLMPSTAVMFSSSTPIKQSSPECITPQCLVDIPIKQQVVSGNGINNNNSSSNSNNPVRCRPVDDIRIDLRKTGGGSGRSVKLELRELLDLVLTSASHSPNPIVLADSGKIYTPHPGTSQRPPVGLVTQLLWRARALDDRGPWILTFSMWWLMQHYFGIGSRMHHVRLRWGHVRLVSGVIDPMTGELCDAIEYVGPPNFTTVRACALPEINPGQESSSSSAAVGTAAPGSVIRRVYPSSGWAEPEITVATALSTESKADRPRVRPLDTDPSVPPVPPRSGPDFVALYKSFARHRQEASLLPDSPFYVQPLQNSSSAFHSKSSIAWFSIGALGKNRIGALMRNIVDKVVRPDMPKVATAALSAATSACVIAADRAALALPDNHCVGVGSSTKIPSSDLSTRQQALVDKLSCLLGTNMSSMMMTTVNTRNDVQKININTNSHNNNNNTSINNGSSSSSGSNTVIISRLNNPETNVLLLSPSSSAGVVQQQQALPTTITSPTAAAATDIMRSPNHFLLKVPKLVTSSATNTIINTPTTNNISLSSMIAPLSTSPPEPPVPQVLRNQIVYETSASSIQQAQQSSQMQCPSLVFTQQPYLQQQQQQQQQYQQQQQQTFIQDTATTTFLLLTTVDGQTFLAPAGGCFAGFNNNNANNNNNNQSPGGGYILLPTATSTATHSTNIVTPGSIVTNPISQIEHTDVVQQQQQQQQQSPYGQYHHHPVQSSINMPMLIYGSGGGGGYSPVKGQNMVVSPYQLTTVMGGTPSIPVTTTTTTTTTTTSAITRSLVTPRTFQQQQQQQPIAYHLTSNPTSSNNSLPVNVILLSNNSTSTSSSTSPILLSNSTSSNSSNTPAVVHSQSIHLPGTIYQTENRCDIDFSMYSARETSTANTTTTAGSSMPSTVGLVDSSFQPLIIQRNDSNIATVLLNTNSDSSPVRRTITLMNSGNPLTVLNNNNSGSNSMTSRPPVVVSSSSPSTTSTPSVLPACNQILCGRSSLQQPQVQPPAPPQQQQQQQHQQTQPTVLFDTSTSSVSNTTNSMTNGGTAATALLHLSPMKTSGYHQQSPSNSLIQALSSCGQLIAITQPIDGESVVGGSVLQPVIHHNQMLQQQRVQQHQLINSSSDLITGGQQQHQQQQPTITILPISNNNNSNNNNNSVSIDPNNNSNNGNNNSGIKSDLYFELPMIDGGGQNSNSNNNNNNPGQTVYRLLCSDNSSDRMLLTNNISNNNNNNEISRLVFVHTTNNQNNNSNNNSSLSETMNSIFTTENSLYPPATLSSTLPPTSSSTTPPSMITSTNDHHFLIDHFPSVIINQQQQQHQQQPLMNGGYSSSLASPQPSVSSSFSSSASSSSSSSLASSMISMKTTSSGVGSKSGSLVLVSTANPTISSSILQSSKISLLTTSKLKKDQDNVDTTTTTTNNNNNNNSNNANCTTSVMVNSPHLLNAGYFIKGDDNQYLRPSPTILTIMTISPTKREQQFNNDMSNNNSINNNNNNNKGNTSNNNNNFLSTLPPLSSMTCYLIPIEPKPEQLKTLQSVINSASAFQCSDFPAYVEQLFRKGILSGLRPWCLNFTAWFINTLVFEVENRTEHVSLRWGDFRLCKTADGRIEYIYFINRITNKRYYLASSPTSCCALGYNKSEFDNKSLNEPPVRCPCPVTIFKALRDRRPSGCLDPYSKFYLQPRNVECPEANAIAEIHDRVQKCHLLPAYSNWFTEHAWGKNKLGGLFAEASRLAGLPTIWLRKHRSRNFFPGGGGSGIGALGNHLHHQEKKKKKMTTAIATTMTTATATTMATTVKEGNNNNNENSSSHQFTSTRENDIGNGDDDVDEDNGDDADDYDGHGGGGGGEENHFDDDDDGDDVILDPGDDHTSRSKENNNDDDDDYDDLSTHTEVKRRCILNTVQRSTTNAISLPATTNSTTFIYNQQEDSCITTATGTTTATTTNSVNILPSSMTILKPKEIIYTSTINQ